jgi:hypothetical protein
VVKGVTQTTDGGSSVSGTSSTSSSGSTLPFTGGDVAGLALIGAGAVGVGYVLTRHSRRRRAVVSVPSAQELQPRLFD